MKQVNLGYAIKVFYKKNTEVTIDTDIVDLPQAIDYAIECVMQDMFIENGYHLDKKSVINSIQVIDNTVTVE